MPEEPIMLMLVPDVFHVIDGTLDNHGWLMRQQPGDDAAESAADASRLRGTFGSATHERQWPLTEPIGITLDRAAWGYIDDALAYWRNVRGDPGAVAIIDRARSLIRAALAS